MSDPYKVLGISPTATEEEIKAAYRALAKKYHPDNYADSPLNDLAAEKMKEINEAYDEAMRRYRSGNASSSTSSGWGSSYGGYNAASNFTDVRNMIRSGRIADAEQILNGVPLSGRDAEWYFLKGTVLYRRGWMDDAYSNLQTACQMDPSNQEYRAALNQLEAQRNGNFGGYAQRGGMGGMSGCDLCSNLLCADCCCECMGGDLIPCC